jgi:NAD(P)-dependent dehydrogenase (short-subunit alcohol dehydrogenase family)
MKTALVTGAASGLGKHLALMYAGKGYSVYALDINRGNLDKISTANIIPLCADITKNEEWDGVVIPRIEADGKGLDVVVACASVMHIGSVEECSLEDWQFVNAINLTAQFLTAKKTLKYLKTNKGNILFIGSPSAKLAVRDEVCYVTFKHAICGLSKSVAFDFGEDGVRSNVLHPGWIRTAMSDLEMKEIMDRDKVSLDEAYATATRFVPMKRPGSLDEIGQAAYYLTSDQASYITGTEMMADGGLTIVDPGMVGFM